MAPPAWAYQVDHYTPAPDEELICSICQNVFCDPVQSPCDHVFCRGCVSKWLENNRNCPICRKRTTRSTLREVVPIVKNMILKLKLRCHNSERGCRETFTLEGCESHSKICPYELIQCKNKPCKSMLMRKEVKHHETKDCSHSYVRCKNCKLKITFRSTETHDCIVDLRKKLKEKSHRVKKLCQKVKKLREEVKNLKESEEYSDSSELSLTIADAFLDYDSRSSSMDSQITSEGSDDDFFGSLREPFVFSRATISLNEDPYPAMQNASSSTPSQQSSNNTSIEYPRTFSPISLNDSSVLLMDSTGPSMDIADGEEPQVMIRPTKRRLNTRVLSSSDDESQSESVHYPSPSRKRTLQLSSQARVGSPSTSNASGPSPSFLTSGADLSASNNVIANYNSLISQIFTPGTIEPVPIEPVPIDAGSPPQATIDDSRPQTVSPIFQRTISLLRRYNIESDPEWFPPNPDGESQVDLEDSDNDPPYELPGHITSSDESSISDLDDSDSSYEDAPGDLFQTRKNDFLHSFYGSSTETDD